MGSHLSDAEIDRWRFRLEGASKDQNWLEHNRKRDQQRIVVRQGILDLLDSYLAGRISIDDLKGTFDRKTRTEWDYFGLKGASGAMFLNMLVKHWPDREVLSDRLVTAIRKPPDEDAGRHQLREFVEFLETGIRSGAMSKREIQVPRTAFFLSAWWHMQDVEQWPIYYVSGKQALQVDGIYTVTGNPVEDYFRFRGIFQQLVAALDLSPWQLEHLFVWMTEGGSQSTNQAQPQQPAQTLVVSDDTPVAVEREEDVQEGSKHAQVQWLLATIGRRLGCRVWIAANDHNRKWNGDRLGDLSMSALPSLGMDAESQRIISLIDVLWIKGTKQVVAAFEVESTTSIYSGLLRMSDLAASSPNINFPLYIAVPEDRRDKVRRELSRPTFQTLEMPERCAFFSFEQLIESADRIMEWASDPAVMQRLASKVGGS